MILSQNLELLMYRESAVFFITLLNAVIYLCWLASGASYFEASFMSQNFLVSWNGLLAGRVWTLLTSAFSHISLIHIFLNMYVLNSFGPVLEKILGTKSFLKFYIVSGVISSLAHAVVSTYFLHRPELQALGASGAISGLIIFFSLMFPQQLILLFGIIPLPAIFAAMLFVALDLWGLVVQAEGGGLPIGHGAHLGGAFCGVIYYFIYNYTANGSLFK